MAINPDPKLLRSEPTKSTLDGFIEMLQAAWSWSSTSLISFQKPITVPVAASPPIADGLYRDGFVRGWARFDQTTSDDTLDDSYNVSSVAEIATGRTTVNWNTDFANDTYSVTVAGTNQGFQLSAFAVGSVEVQSRNKDGTLANSALACAIAVGDQS